jgi:hypothetical protein
VGRIFFPKSGVELTLKKWLNPYTEGPERLVASFKKLSGVLSLHQVIYRPVEEGALALRGYTFGLDVVVRIGQLRYRENQSLTQIHQALQEHISISLKEVASVDHKFSRKRASRPEKM